MRSVLWVHGCVNVQVLYSLCVINRYRTILPIPDELRCFCLLPWQRGQTQEQGQGAAQATHVVPARQCREIFPLQSLD